MKNRIYKYTQMLIVNKKRFLISNKNKILFLTRLLKQYNKKQNEIFVIFQLYNKFLSNRYSRYYIIS